MNTSSETGGLASAALGLCTMQPSSADVSGIICPQFFAPVSLRLSLAAILATPSPLPNEFHMMSFHITQLTPLAPRQFLHKKKE